MMLGSDLDVFARLLMEHIRDGAIVSCDSLVAGTTRGVLGERWQAQLSGTDARTAISELLPDVVDQVLFHLLDAIDNRRLPLGWLDGEEATSLEELGQGEMGGLFMMGEGGWIDRFSRQRSFDPLSDLDS